jgi:hypothetical protein
MIWMHFKNEQREKPKEGCECESKRKRLGKISHRGKEEHGKKLRSSFGKTNRWASVVVRVPA